jgi:Activator of Hsp90 ATPase homolog 1-like protein
MPTAVVIAGPTGDRALCLAPRGGDRTLLRCPGGAHLADVDRPGALPGLVRPDGATIPVAKMDVRVGGTRLVCMEMDTPDGPRLMWFTGEYLEVVENERLVYTESMSDEDGSVSSPSDMGMPAGHPMTAEVRVELDDVGGRTQDGADPRRGPRRLAWCHRLGDGARQARRPSRSAERPKAPMIAEPARRSRFWSPRALPLP